MMNESDNEEILDPKFIAHMEMMLRRGEQDEREILESLPAATDDDVATVRRTLGPLVTRHTKATTSARIVGRRAMLRRLAGPIAALALISTFVMVWAARVGFRARGSAEKYLGGDSDPAMSPSGSIAHGYGAFRWDYEAPPGGRFVVDILDGEGGRLTSSGELSEKSWTLDPVLSATLPDVIVWRLTILSAMGDVVRTYQTQVSRSGS